MHYSAHMPSSPQSTSILSHLADRVRSLRRARGWSRSELAAHSGLSSRFLARVEGGDGNISVLRLEELASALATTPDALLRAPATARVVALVGMRGAGKSTIGPLLASRLELPFVEMDQRIIEASGLPLEQMFELHGEPYYRRMERETVREILDSRQPQVLAASGGVVNEPWTWERLLEQATVVWLRASPEDHWNRVVGQGDRRPMEGNPDAMQELRAMLTARERMYARADLLIETSGRDPETIADEIADELRDAA